MSKTTCNVCRGTGFIDPDIHLVRGGKTALCGIPKPGRTRRTSLVEKATCAACLIRAAAIEANREVAA